jgi:aryl-alcohol dehydrogenase-like predicted oxidoreductase
VDDDMRYVELGRTGLMVSRLGLGTMQFGWSIDEVESHQVLDAFSAAGGNLIDTADIYSTWSASAGGPPNAGGVSEEIIGRWLTARGLSVGRGRDDVVLATKVRGPMGEGGGEGRRSVHQREGLSRRWITTACEDSLRRLGVDHIDLYQVHYVDARVPIEETMGALTDLVRAGKVRYLGCSNFSAWRLVEALWTSDRRGLEAFASVQPEYSLLSPTRADFERELAPACQAHGIGVLPYSPLGGGLLTGKYRRGGPLPDSLRADEHAARRLDDRNWDLIEALVAASERAGLTPAQTAIGWVMAKPVVTAPIIGANSVRQLHDTMTALEHPLPPAEVAALDRASAWERPRTGRED